MAKFEYTTLYQKAMDEILSLRLEKGKLLVAEGMQKDPTNSLFYLAEDYIDFFTLLINENEAEYEALLKNKTTRIDKIDADDAKSPWYNYCKAEIYMHWATHRIRFGDYFKAATEIREAYKLLEKNIKNHPSFLPNNKTMGMLETLVGTVPEGYQWVVNIIGMEGDIENGISKIQSVINTQQIFIYVPQLRKEALFIYVYLQMYVVKKPQQAWELVEKNTQDYATNLLSCYLRSNIALRTKKTDEAITVLKNRPKSKDYHNFYYLDFLMGQAKQYRGDADADTYFKRYVSFHPGKNYIKSAYVRLAWFYYLQGNTAKFATYKTLAKKFGAEEIEEDKRAQKLATEASMPDTTLLNAMLFFDGGYLDKALATLNKKNEASFTTKALKLEYNYRKARTLHEKGTTAQAIELYTKVMDEGKDLEYYFAANSCLMLGNLYEDMKHLSTACNYYKRCSKFPNKEYRNSIQQKAKAGIKRLKCN